MDQRRLPKNSSQFPTSLTKPSPLATEISLEEAHLCEKTIHKVMTFVGQRRNILINSLQKKLNFVQKNEN
jgi:hypothetical protein